jgi:hypothetical protein
MKTIKTTDGQEILVSNVDFKRFNKLWWKVDSWGYAYTYIRGLSLDTRQMHRIILNPKKGEYCDHKNRNRLDNRRSNLRIATRSQNQCNRNIQSNNKTGYIGVSWDKINKTWRANIQKFHKAYNLGRYDSKEDAAKAYNRAAKKMHGLFANLNKI